MAISPADAMKITPEEKDAVDRIEAEIDRRLLDHYQASLQKECWIESSKLGKTPRMREEVVRRFKQAGWIVEFISDQRDGDAYKFVPRR